MSIPRERKTYQYPRANGTSVNEPMGYIDTDHRSWLTNASTKPSSNNSSDRAKINFLKVNFDRATLSRPRRPELKRVDDPRGTRVSYEIAGPMPVERQKVDTRDDWSGPSEEKQNRRGSNSSSGSGSSKNFIKLNAERVISSRARRPDLKIVDSVHGNRESQEYVKQDRRNSRRRRSLGGKLPNYLLRMKLEEEQERLRVEERVQELIEADEKSQYSAEEREKVILFLRQYFAQLNSKYLTLSLTLDTISMRMYRKELEDLMDEVTKSIEIMQSDQIIYKSEFPPQESKFRDQWREILEDHDGDTVYSDDTSESDLRSVGSKSTRERLFPSVPSFTPSWSNHNY